MRLPFWRPLVGVLLQPGSQVGATGLLRSLQHRQVRVD